MRKLIARLLTFQARRFLGRSKARVVVVVGSVGKTSTTQAIAAIVAEQFRVRKTIANYNTDVGVPCSMFDEKLPGSLKNPLSWISLFIRNERALHAKQDVEVFVLELGTDVPGEIAQFSWLQPDIAVVSAVADEHMEYFRTIEAVAEEELSVSRYSQMVLVNEKMVDSVHHSLIDGDVTMYSREDLRNFNMTSDDLSVVGAHSVDAVVAGLHVGALLGVSKESLKQGAKNIRPQPGRMNVLPGVKKSVLIDDTYNASPEATKVALNYLYTYKAPQRIALLGNMNELGDTSKDSHIELGEYCQSLKLDLVVTLGPDANTYTAEAARAKGCEVIETKTPYAAADAILEKMKEGAVVLLKGSQNKVFAEEATLKLLENPDDASKLVRQSEFWKKKKQENFKEG